MPIRPENKALYPANWKEISLARREAAGQKCEWCKAPNGVVIYRFADGSAYMTPNGDSFDATDGTKGPSIRGSEMPKGRFTKVVLTVAHLNHDPRDCSDENLRALCQKCHNAYDAPMRRKGIVERKALPLFDGGS